MPFPHFPTKTSLFHPPSPCSLPHLLLLPCPIIPLHWGIKHSQTKDLSSHWYPARPSSATHAAGAMEIFMDTLLLVVKYVGDLGVLVGSYCCSSYGAANPLHSLGPFSNFPTGDPVLSSLAGWKYPSLYLLGTFRVSQQTTISDSFHLEFGIHNRVCDCYLHMWYIPRWGSICIAFPSVLAPQFVSVSIPMGILFSFIRDPSIYTWSSFFELHVVCELYLRYSKILS